MNVVVVEDSELIRTQLLRVLSQQPGLHVVGSAADEEWAVRLILDRNPEVVLLDLALSPGSGVKVLQRIRQAGCQSRVVILTNNDEDPLRQTCMGLGVAGFFDKSRETQSCVNLLCSWVREQEEESGPSVFQHPLVEPFELVITPEQECFDDITRLARHMTGMPVAVISLAGDQDRQCFLSRSGSGFDLEASRLVPFCADTMLRNGLLEISHVAEDALIPFRFYAGVPLVRASGEVLGTLCVIDVKPNRLTREQGMGLKTLARSVVAEIELRQRVMGLKREVKLRKAAEMQALQLSAMDSLTGLPNRVTFHDRLNEQIKLARRYGSSFGVFFVDMDHFKQINDTLGHDQGDEALLLAARRLTQSMREADSVARLGGDEFAVLLPHLSGPTEGLFLAKKLLAEFSAPLDHGQHFFKLGASIGIALYPRHGEDAELLLRRADMAMLHSKQAGGGRATVFSKEMDVLVPMNRSLDMNLQEAMQRDELELYYQPQVDLQTGELRGMEALVRWNHPEMGLLSPDRFIALAENSGIIRELGRHLMNKALDQLVEWDRNGLEVPCLAINVSPLELRPGYAEFVVAAVQRRHLDPARIEIEVTESALNADAERMLSVLTALREAGLQVAMDDFGVGYSSLSRLKHLPIDVLKIDRAFVNDVQDSAGSDILKAVVAMGAALGLSVVAEGIESEAQRDLLKDMGCGYGQGYFYGKPQPSAATAEAGGQVAG